MLIEAQRRIRRSPPGAAHFRRAENNLPKFKIARAGSIGDRQTKVSVEPPEEYVHTVYHADADHLFQIFIYFIFQLLRG